MALTLRQLEVFLAVAVQGSVTRAAAALGVSQGAVSMALSDLEKQLGEKIFDRQDNRLMLNASGRALLPMASEIQARMKEVEQYFGSHGDHLAGQIRLGASSTIGNYVAPDIVGSFSSHYPKVQLTLKIGNSETIVHDLTTYNIDLGLIEGQTHHPDLDIRPWAQDQLVIVASPRNPLSRQAVIHALDLGQQRWILRESGSGTREIFEAAATGVLDAVEVFLELGQTEAIKRAVAADLGIGCVSSLAVSQEIELGRLVILPTPFLNLSRNFYLLHRKGQYMSRSLAALLFFLTEWTKSPAAPLSKVRQPD